MLRAHGHCSMAAMAMEFDPKADRHIGISLSLLAYHSHSLFRHSRYSRNSVGGSPTLV